MMLLNVKLDLRRCQRITFQACIFHWAASFFMAKTKLAMLALLYYGEIVKKITLKNNRVTIEFLQCNRILAQVTI